jgi:uncharacterized protein (DUF885 family)
MNQTEILNALFAEEWEFRLREDPILATRSSDSRYNDRLPALNEADFERRAAVARSFLERLHAIDPQTLPADAALNYLLFERSLQNTLTEYGFQLYRMPLTKLTGPHTDLPDLLDVTPFNNLTDYEAYLARLQAIELYLSQHIDLLRIGMKTGLVPALVAMQGIEEALTEHLPADPTSSPFYKPFERFPAGISHPEAQQLAAVGQAVIQSVVIPAFQALRDFIVQEYLPACRVEISAASLPNGRAYYDYCVRRYTSLALTPEQVHATGLDEVRRIRAEMEAVIRETGIHVKDGVVDFQAFLKFLRTDPRFYATTPEALLKRVALILKRMDGELPRLFKTLPRTPYGIRETPAFIAPRSTSAYYFLPSGDLSTAGFYYVNTYDLSSRPLYEYEALSFHEAVPGHHLQLALQMEMPTTPTFRRFLDMTAFIEGWALYAERLGLEVGFYSDSFSNFGRLIFEMWRACRLVVDTGMHALGWSRQQAIDYMAANTALSHLNIVNEIDRYIAWPGQALAYKVGELAIRSLRQQAENALGSRFDRREFHDILLAEGALPLDVLEARIKDWIHSQTEA